MILNLKSLHFNFCFLYLRLLICKNGIDYSHKIITEVLLMPKIHCLQNSFSVLPSPTKIQTLLLFLFTFNEYA